MIVNVLDRKREYRNLVEGKFAAWARAKGWKITKRGWPDFFCEVVGGNNIAVECKRKLKSGKVQRLRFDQHGTMQFLTSVGVECFVWGDDSLEPFSPTRHAPRQKRNRKEGL